MSNLVNTSLPAKMAPKLAPATLASLTTNHEATAPKPYSLSERLSELRTGTSGFAPYQKPYQAPSSVALTSVKKPTNTEEEFPSLGAAKPKTVAASGKPSFSELSRDWGKKQKEEEEKAKEEAKKEADHQRQLLQEQEKRQNIRIIPVRIAKKKQKEEELPLSDLSDDPPMEYEEEEEEEECEDGWNGRKHRDELY